MSDKRRVVWSQVTDHSPFLKWDRDAKTYHCQIPCVTVIDVYYHLEDHTVTGILDEGTLSNLRMLLGISDVHFIPNAKVKS